MDARRIAETIRARPALFGLIAVAGIIVAVLMWRVFFTGSTFTIEAVADAQSGTAEAETSADGSDDDALEQEQTVYVHVSGAVQEPGLYELPEGSRIAAAVEAAGGFSEEAATDGVNLARVLFDGEQIVVPTIEEAAAGSTSEGSSTTSSSSLVNINTASASELDTLPGIGPATAEKIIADREANGPFTTIEDLKRVSGIGDKKYENLADLICV